MFVDIAIVLAGAESAVLLFDEEEGRSLGGIGWADLPRSEVFVQEIFGGFAFVRGEGVNLPDFRGEGFIEVDFMVVGSERGNVVGSFFREH